MRYIILLLTLLVFAWQPTPAMANRTPGNRIKARAAKTVQVLKTARTKLHAKFAPARRIKTKLAAKFKMSLRMRASVRSKLRATKSANSSLDLNKAASEVATPPTGRGAALSARERFALWRTAQSVKRAAIKQTKRRSAQGDIQGTNEAVQAIEALRASGKLGWVARWRARSARGKAFANFQGVAKMQLAQGDSDAAGQSYAYAMELGDSPGKSKTVAKKAITESFKLAEYYSKAGNPHAAISVLQMAVAVANHGNAKFEKKKAEALIKKAFVRSLPILTEAANKAYKSGDIGQALQLLAEVRAIQKDIGIKPGVLVKRTQVKLTKRLGSRLTDFEAAQEQAAQQQDAEQRAAEQHAAEQRAAKQHAEEQRRNASFGNL